MKQQRSTNILLVMTDEHAPRVAGFSGDPVVRTQNLDRLADRSFRFANATCTYPVCTPSRMSMLCGKDAHRCGAWNNHWIIPPEHVTWPGHFAAHGYRTCLVGKMHFGGRDQMHGFQVRPYGDLRHGLGHQPDPLSMYPGYHNPESAGISEIPESLMQDVVVTRESLAFALEHHDREPDVPWFLCASYGRPHSPLTTPGRYLRRYKGRVPAPDVPANTVDELEPFARRLVFNLDDEQTQRAREGYYACVDFVDDCIGELLDGLDQAGLLDNTIIVYVSDHGEMAGNFGCWGKQLYYEPSIGVPLLISGPDLRSGLCVEHPISLIDLFPTTCRLAGLPIPDGLDGVDFSPVLHDNDPSDVSSPREFAPSAAYRYAVVVSGLGIDEAQPSMAWRCVRERDWKYVEVERGAKLLFDLVHDPFETKNLANVPEYAKRCQRMRKNLYTGFCWEDVHRQLARDRTRRREYASGFFPGTPNQYMLPDGRIFDAEKSLYDARWLELPPGFSGGIIPQQFG